jgi:uncharacterized protein (DUF983 family)
MLGRGLSKRCPACGTGGLYEGWFRMRERCPRCLYRFEREEGFFLGAYVVNLAITEGLLLVLGIIPLIVVLAANPDASLVPMVAIGLGAAVIGPILFYPFSRTIWVAIELISRPRDEGEPTDST